MTIRFDGQVAIVTGAGAGLGRAHALALAAYGAKIVVNDLAGAEDVAAEIVNAGGEAIAHSANVTDLDAVEDMTASALSKWGGVDILVNNAGILRDRSSRR